MYFKWIILALVLLQGCYRVLLHLAQYRSAKNPTPENVADVYDAETYQTWRRYNAEHCRLDIVSAIVSCLISLGLLYSGVYAAFTALLPDAAFWQLFAVVILESAVDFVVGTVEHYVGTMVIEQKYGFNRSTMKTFVFDRIRSLLLGLILNAAIVGLMFLLHREMGDYIILLFAGVMFAFTMLISFLYPVFSRIGNKFVPLEEGELRDHLMALLEKHGYKVRAIEVMDASRRTTKLNAYFVGFGKMKRIVLYDNLVNAMTPDEICAVFAHELGHGLHKDVLKNQILNIGNLLLMSVVVWFTLREPLLYTAFGFTGINYGFAYVLIGVLLGVIQPFTSILMNLHSRKAEYRADRQAVEEGYGEAMVMALKKLAKDNFANLAPSRLNVVMEYSHPPLSLRIAEVERQTKKL